MTPFTPADSLDVAAERSAQPQTQIATPASARKPGLREGLRQRAHQEAFALDMTLEEAQAYLAARRREVMRQENGAITSPAFREPDGYLFEHVHRYARLLEAEKVILSDFGDQPGSQKHTAARLARAYQEICPEVGTMEARLEATRFLAQLSKTQSR